MSLYFHKKTWNLILKTILLGYFFSIAIPNTLAQHSKIDSLNKVIHKAELEANFTKKDTSYINSLLKLGKVYRFNSSDSLLSIANKTLTLSKIAGFDQGVVKAYSLFGFYYSGKGENSKAIKNFEKALHLNKDKETQASLMNSLAREYNFLGNYAMALRNYLKGIDLAKEVGNYRLQSSMNENIANLYTQQKDYTQGLVFYEKAIKMNEELGDRRYIAQTLSNIALTYSHLKKYDLAMSNINRSISIFEKEQVLDWLAFAYAIKGRIYLDQEIYNWAVHFYEQSIMLHDKIDDERGKAHILNNLSKAYLSVGKDSLALVCVEKGFAISKKVNSLIGKKEASDAFYLVYKKNKDFSKALFYHELYKKFSDSLTRSDNEKNLSLLKVKLNYEKEREVLVDKSEKALARQRVIIYLSLAVLLILTLITAIVLKGQKVQKQLNKKLRLKTVLIQKREIELSRINKTKNKLFSIIGHDLRGPIGALQELLRLFSNGDIKKNELDTFIPKLKSDVDNLFFTLNNLLSWGKSQMEGASIKPSNFTIKKLADRNIKLLSEMAANKSIKIINHIDNMVITWADQNQIDIVVRNLISNAIKFTPENGLITISAKKKNNSWQIEIKDSGIGMTKSIQDKIFIDHSNVTTYGTNNEKGTGLGLSLCKEMVEKNNGKIWVQSKIDKGSSFYFTIPKEKSDYQKAS